MKEQWKAVLFHYAVSNKYRIARLTYGGPKKSTWPGRILTHPDRNHQVHLYCKGDGTHKIQDVSLLRWFAFQTSPPWSNLSVLINEKADYNKKWLRTHGYNRIYRRRA